MRGAIGRILARYGQVVTVNGRSTRAFVQPVRQRREQVPGEWTPLGWNDTRLWLYLGRMPVTEGDTVVWGPERFRVRSSRVYAVGQRVTHWWALLEVEKEEAEA